MTISLTGWKAFAFLFFGMIGAFDVIVGVPTIIYMIAHLPSVH